jgi:ABC-2 type transport system permease protein
MPKRYSQFRASLAIAKASLWSMFRSPTSVVFSLLFPIIFIVVFGSMVDNAAIKIKIGVAEGCDTTNIVYKAISAIKIIQPQTTMSQFAMTEALKKGQIAAILNIKNTAGNTPGLHYDIALTTAEVFRR